MSESIQLSDLQLALMRILWDRREANSLEVTKGVEDAIRTMQPGLAGIEFDTNVYRPASYLERSIDNLTLALILGLALVALVLGLFFRWRTAVISLVVILVFLSFPSCAGIASCT